ncbi:MAG: bifunctional UDP-N-acetylmuramoyl-L-alanyl-D-glutamate--2,6-diaminopimelate ligase [Pseudomonadota bacterium]|jgi:murE/murF fusion protein
MQGNLCSDSRAIRHGDTFLAWPGTAHDARQHVQNALQQGAVRCWIEKKGADAFHFEGDDRIECVENLQTKAGAMAAAFFDHPSRALSVIAVTGTNGKTTTAYWLAQALSCGMVGTLGVGRIGHLHTTGLTTPDPVVLQGFFRELVDAGVKTCAIEASSIGMEEQRLNGTHIRVAVFTNFTQDHLDYHGSMETYWAAKRQLFDWQSLESAVINIDDPLGAELAQALAATHLDVLTVSCADSDINTARLRAQAIRYDNGGLCFEVCEGDSVETLRTTMVGEYNVANLLGVMGAMRALGIPLADVVQACRSITPVPGRMERVGEQVVIDYAHTPDALRHVLQALRPLAQQRGGRLWCVFGCGGDRDTSKRPLMGAIAEQNADRIVVTSDNPRSESPSTIIDHIMAGISHPASVSVQIDRAAAIDYAVRHASVNDIVLVAGKGHESTQEIAGILYPFSDRMHAEIPYARVHTDTRTIQQGDLFVAIRGEHYDGNAFLHEAYARGAIAAICHPNAEQPAGMVCFVVPDTRKALCQLALIWRAKFAIPLIAVTGSNGKTTVTQMIASILAAAQPDGAFLATQGNLNNDIGVALTLLRLRAHHRVAVVELGMNHAGEIAVLAAMAQPSVALINNAQREHLEFMHTVQAVAEENGSVIHALGTQGVVVIPADDDYTPLWRTMAGERKVVAFSMQDEPVYSLAITGRHNMKNAFAAAACARAAGVDEAAIQRGLAAFLPVKGRSRLLRWGRLNVIDDTYNANPDSVRAAIDVLAELPAPRLLILGDMGEVGENGASLHAEVGAYAQNQGIEKMQTVGDLARHASHAFVGAVHCSNMDNLIHSVHQTLPQVCSVLVKGSRFMRMERVIDAMEGYSCY